MNRNGFLIFSTILLIVVYLLVYRYDPEHEENFAKFIPDNALMYVEQRDGESAIASFKNSAFGRNFESIDFYKTGKKIGLPEKITKNIELIKNNYHKLFNNDVVKTLLGKRFGLAFFYPPKDITTYTIKSFLKDNCIIIAEPRLDVDFLTFLAEHYISTRDDISIQTIQYGNHHISRITTSGGRISLSSIDGLMVASFNEKLLKQSIDTYDGEEQSIFDEPTFKKAQEQYYKPDRFFYLPVETIHMIAYDTFDFIDPEYIALIQEQLDLTLGFRGVYYGAWFHPNFVEDKIIFTYSDGYTIDAIDNILGTPPSTNTLLDLTTTDPLAYYWSNTIDLKHFLKYIPKDSKSPNPVNQYVEKLEDLSHKTVEQIISSLGQEVSIVVEKSGEDNFIPVPLVAAFFRINPEVELSEMVNYIVDAFEVPVIEQVYNSVTYLYWVASPQDGLQPLCGYWSNLFFIGNSAQLIERVIDGYNENRSLLNNPQLVEIDPGITETNNSITYLNNIEILDLSERLLSVLATIIILEDKDKAAKARSAINEVILPLFNGLKEYERSCTRSYFVPGMAVIDSRTSVAPKMTH